MQKISKGLILGIGLLCMAPSAFAQWRTLSVPLTTQQHSQWCWAASSSAVLNYFGQAKQQCDIVNWAFGINYACGSSYFNWNSYANQPNNIFGGGGSVQGILYNGGVNSLAVNDYLSWAHITSDINSNHPFVMRYGWTSGGGHILVGRGYDIESDGSRYIYLMNPWPGEGMTYASYNYAIGASDHYWTHSLRTY
jgi:hypothetical protein